MKNIFFILSFMAFISCRSEKEIIAPTPQIDLTNIKDSAYFLIKWQGKEYFLRENPAKNIVVVDGGLSNYPSQKVYSSLFGNMNDLELDRFTLYITSPKTDKFSYSDFLNLLSVGKKKPSLDKSYVNYLINYEKQTTTKLKSYIGALSDEDQYFEIIDSKPLTEERGSPSLILVKFRFKLKMNAPNQTNSQEYMEGEIQTRVQYWSE